MSSKKRSTKLRYIRRPLSRRSRRAITLLIGLLLAAMVLGQRSCRLHRNDSPPQSPTTHTTDRLRYHHKTCTVVNVVDGDTLDIDLPDADKPLTRIRLWGVDTPETKHPQGDVMYWGPQASDFARQFVLGKKVMIALEPTRNSRGKYGRLLAYVYRIKPDGSATPTLMLNEQLIAQGHGYADERFNHVLKRRFERLQNEAQAEQRGLWKNVTPKQWPQWYRRRHDPAYTPQERPDTN